MKKKIRGRVLARILAAALLCTAIPETVYAVEMPEEAVWGQTMEEDMLPEDGEMSEDEKSAEHGNVSDNDLSPGDADEAEEQETEQPSDEETEETGEEESQTEILEEEGILEEELSGEIGMDTVYDGITVFASSGNGIVDRLDELRGRYPHGKYWWSKWCKQQRL